KLLSDGATTAGTPESGVTIDRIVIEDGAIAFQDESGRQKSGLDHLNFEVLRTPGNGAKLAADLVWAGQRLEIALGSSASLQGLDSQPVPLQFRVHAPALLQAPLSGTTQLRKSGRAFAINALNAKSGETTFEGSASVDFSTSKPLVNGDFDFSRL